MDGFLRRLRRQSILFTAIGSVVAPFLVASLFPSFFGDVGEQGQLLVARAVVLTVFFLVIALIGWFRFRRSSRVRPLTPDDLTDFLAQHDSGYGLLLRSFGRDGYVLLPRANRRGSLREGTPWTHPITSAEEVIARATRDTLDVRLISIVDQKVRLAPPGPTFRRVSDDDWKTVVERLIERARVIVLLLGPDQHDGPGLQWEVDRIGALATPVPVVIVLPPPDGPRSTESDPVILERASAILHRLQGRAAGSDQHVLPSSTFVVVDVPPLASTCWGIGSTLPDVPDRRGAPTVLHLPVSDRSYAAALTQAFRSAGRGASC